MVQADFLLFWYQHFRRPHIRFQMMAAADETEYNNLANIAGYRIRRKKNRHKRSNGK